jgi:hypothetical protein
MYLIRGGYIVSQILKKEKDKILHSDNWFYFNAQLYLMIPNCILRDSTIHLTHNDENFYFLSASLHRSINS